MSDNNDRGHSGTKRKHRNRPTAKPKSGPVETVKVEPMLWGQRLLHHPDCLLWVNAATLIVCNSRRHRDYMRRILNHG